MKRRDFMKLSAATALGATVAAMAPSGSGCDRTGPDQRRSAHYRRSQDRSYGFGRWQDLCL